MPLFDALEEILLSRDEFKHFSRKTVSRQDVREVFVESVAKVVAEHGAPFLQEAAQEARAIVGSVFYAIDKDKDYKVATVVRKIEEYVRFLGDVTMPINMLEHDWGAAIRSNPEYVAKVYKKHIDDSDFDEFFFLADGKVQFWAIRELKEAAKKDGHVLARKALKVALKKIVEDTRHN